MEHSEYQEVSKLLKIEVFLVKASYPRVVAVSSTRRSEGRQLQNCRYWSFQQWPVRTPTKSLQYMVVEFFIALLSCYESPLPSVSLTYF